MAVALKNRSRLAGSSLALFCLSVILSAYSARNPWTREIGASLGSYLLQPIQTFSNFLGSGVTGSWGRYVALVDVKAENGKLKERLEAVEAQNSRLLELETENTQLRSLLSYNEETHSTGIAARVIGRGASNWLHSIVIDRGSDHGVNAGMAVVNGNGVVGHVVASGPTSATVLLVLDHTSGVDAIVQSSRARGVVEGTGDGCRLMYVLGHEEVQIGDRIITSGMDGIYPKGLSIGVVSDVDFSRREDGMFKPITMRPTVDFLHLEHVLVVPQMDEGTRKSSAPVEKKRKK